MRRKASFFWRVGGTVIVAGAVWVGAAFGRAAEQVRESSAPVAPLTEAQGALERALLGRWVGVLTYRDYAQAADSTKRVQLPTWLSIEAQPEGLRLHYTYDDGPGKTVEDRSSLVVDVLQKTYRVIKTDSVSEDYKVAGLEGLRGGLGELVLSGPGTESGAAVEVRETLTIRRNLLSWLRETRPLQSAEGFSFRHLYTFVREGVPAVTVRGK